MRRFKIFSNNEGFSSLKSGNESFYIGNLPDPSEIVFDAHCPDSTTLEITVTNNTGATFMIDEIYINYISTSSKDYNNSDAWAYAESDDVIPDDAFGYETFTFSDGCAIEDWYILISVTVGDKVYEYEP